jgi:hypothetical protein
LPNNKYYIFGEGGGEELIGKTSRSPSRAGTLGTRYS